MQFHHVELCRCVACDIMIMCDTASDEPTLSTISSISLKSHYNKKKVVILCHSSQCKTKDTCLKDSMMDMFSQQTTIATHDKAVTALKYSPSQDLLVSACKLKQQVCLC